MSTLRSNTDDGAAAVPPVTQPSAPAPRALLRRVGWSTFVLCAALVLMAGAGFLWFIYVGYFMLRGAAENTERGKRFAAILGVVGAVDIPLIHVSVQWWRSQHPKPVVMRPEGAQADPRILQTLFLSLFAFTLLFFALLLFRYGLERLSQRVHALRVARELRPRPAS